MNITIPEVIPFPHKNEKKWKEIVETMRTDIKSFEDLKVKKHNNFDFFF